MINKFPDVERLKILISALERNQSTLITGVFSTMGFMLLGLGWIFTSEKTQETLRIGDLAIYTVIFNWIIWILYTLGSYSIFKASDKIYTNLEEWEYAEGSFEHVKITFGSIVIYSTVIGSVVLLSTMTILSLR